MSAIGISAGKIARTPKIAHAPRTVIGAHADYRPEDFFFARTQSVSLRAAKWQSRIKPQRSWSEIALYCAGLIAILVAGFSFA